MKIAGIVEKLRLGTFCFPLGGGAREKGTSALIKNGLIRATIELREK